MLFMPINLCLKINTGIFCVHPDFLGDGGMQVLFHHLHTGSGAVINRGKIRCIIQNPTFLLVVIRNLPVIERTRIVFKGLKLIAGSSLYKYISICT